MRAARAGGARLVEVVADLGLAFGAVDLIVTPAGDHVFLEVNGNGQWLWLEEEAGCRSARRSRTCSPGRAVTGMDLGFDLDLAAELAAGPWGRRRRSAPRYGGLPRRPDTACRLLARMHAIDRDNTAWLRTVLRDAWPPRSRIGDRAAEELWLLALHADHDRPFQARCAELMAAAVAHGEANPRLYAYLCDRVLVAAGRLQRYGTQQVHTEHGDRPWPVADVDRLQRAPRRGRPAPLPAEIVAAIPPACPVRR